MPISASNLTPSERVRLDRFRRGENQLEAAARWGLSKGVYKRWENGDGTPATPPGVRKLKIGELCYIARMRSGCTQQEVAVATGLCRYTVHRVERCKVPAPVALVLYWGL